MKRGFPTLLLALALGWMGAPAAAQDTTLPTVSIDGSVSTLESCPPNADCPSLGFSFRRSGPGLDRSLTVNLRYGGTATAGVDYEKFPDTVTFPAGSETTFVVSRPIDDTLVEGTETIIGRLVEPDATLPSGYQVDPLHASATNSIFDNDISLVPVVSLQATSPETREPFCDPTTCDAALPAPGIFRLTRRNTDGASELAVWVRFSGTASNGVDYDTLNEWVIFPAGQSAVELQVSASFDLLAEGDEFVVAQLQPDPSLGPIERYRVDTEQNTGRVIIHDNQPAGPQLEITSPTDGQHFEPGEIIPLTARITGLDAVADWVVEFFDGKQRIGQTAPGGTIWWQDALGGTHVINALAFNPAGIPGADTLLARPVTISVGPGPAWPVVSLAATQFRTGEPCPVCFVAPGVFTLSRNGPTNADLAVFLAYDGPAVPGQDYQALPRQVVIPAGRHSVELLVLAIDDLLVEGPEIVRASIALPELATRGYLASAFDNRAMVVIGDDEAGAPAARLDLVAPVEGAQFVEGTVIAITAVGVWTQGELDAAIDFFANDRPIGTVQPPPLGRPTIPGRPSEHTFWWTNPPPGRATLTARTHLAADLDIATPPVTISVGVAPPLPVVRIEATSPVAEESSFPYRRLPFRGEFTISRTGPTTDGLAVFVRYSGTATPAVDYPALPFLVTIPAGAASTTLEVVPIPDSAAEGLETVVAQLGRCPPDTDPPLGIPCSLGYEIAGGAGVATVFIRDDGVTQASVALSSPKDGDTFPEGTPIRIAATAIDLDGAITHVEFFDGDRQIGESTIYFFVQPPPGTPVFHEFSWRGATQGRHALTARAVAASGNEVRSPSVTIGVVESPSDVPLVNVTTRDGFAVEPSPGSELNVAAFRVRRTGSTNLALVVAYSLRGTAGNGTDYEFLPGLVTIPAGRRSVLVTVTPIADQLPEGLETVILQLEGPLTDQIPPPYRVDAPARAGALISDQPWVRDGAQCSRLPEGLAHLCFRADPPSGYRVEASEDLSNWQAVFHGVPVDGALHFIDVDAPQFLRRFYRIVPEPPEVDD